MMAARSKIGLALKFVFNRDYRDYRRVRVLNTFDPNYFDNLLNRDGPEDLVRIIPENVDPLWHYFEISRKQISSVDISPGQWVQLIDPHPLFDTYFYLARYREQIGSRHPFSHYLLEGWRADLKPSPFFDPDFYRLHSQWHEDHGNPLVYYIENHLSQAKDCSLFFSHEWYLDSTPLPAPVRRNAIKHYKLYGAAAGKSPLPVFDPQAYVRRLEGREPHCADPLLHYLQVGEASGIPPNDHFDLEYYRTHCQGGDTILSPLAHYLSKGVFQRCNINFDIASLKEKPMISIVVPVYNPEPAFLNNCIRSVLYQTYPRWELWLVDDCSTADRVRERLSYWSTVDSRINCIFNDYNEGIAATTRIGADRAGGGYIGFLDNDDELAPDCLFHIVSAVNRHNVQVIYTDEDLVGDDGSRHSAFYKPAFNRALLYSHNYITHLVVAARDLFHRAGGLSSDYDGAQDYDLLLRLAENTEAIHHIPRVLYHWRALPTSTSIAHDQKPYAHAAGKSALQNSMIRCGKAAQVEDREYNFHYRIRFSLPETPSVSVLFAASHPEIGAARLRELTDYRVSDYIPLGDAARGSSDAVLIDRTAAWQKAIDACDGEYIAFLGNGADQLSRDWLRELVSKFQLDEYIGITCGRACYNGFDGPSYTVAELEDHSAAYYAAFLSHAARHACGLHNLQYTNACDWQICVIKRVLLQELGGFDSGRFPRHLGMLDLCYRAVARGSKILYTPDAMITLRQAVPPINPEGRSGAEERRLFQQRHRDQLLRLERWYNFQHMANAGVNMEDFKLWLAGGDSQTKLDGDSKLQ